MKRTFFPLAFFILSLILCILAACSSTKTEIINVDPAYREYVSGYSSGMVSRGDVIRVELVDSISRNISKKKLQKIFTISPEIPGKVVLVGSRTLDFIPDKALPSGQFYTANVNLDQLTQVKVGFEEFKFQFSTFEQELDVDLYGFESYNEFELRYQKYVASVSTQDYVESYLLKKSISVTLDGKALNFKLEEDGTNQWELVVDSIKRKDIAQELIIKWNGKAIRSNDAGSRKVKVPAIGDFTVQNVNIFDEDDQYVEIRFDDPISQSQDLEGLIRVVDQKDREVLGLTFEVDFNVVRVFIPNRIEGFYRVECKRGIKNAADGKMLKTVEQDLTFESPKPKVRFIGSGSILPNSQGLIFPFEAISLKAVDVRIIRIYEKNVQHFLQVNDLDGDDELTRFGKIIAESKVRLDGDKSKDLDQWNTHVINLEKWITAEPGAIYQVAIKFDKSYTTCKCVDEKERDFVKTAEDGWNERDWHEYGFDGYSTWSYRDDGSPCTDSYYYGKAIQKNILASNIGMVFKLDVEKRATAFLSDMLTTAPMANAEVAYYDYTTRLIAKGTTNSNGEISTNLKRKPFLMIAKKGNQRGYLKLTDGKVNSLSKFDVSGTYAEEGIKGFLYAERGVWRPGDSIYINFMLQDKKNMLPDSHPVNFEFRDPSGNVLYKVSRNTHLNDVYDFRVATSADGKTGTYQAIVNIGNYSYYKDIKVETIKPNRLKVSIEPKNGKNSDTSTITAAWLHGAKADGLKAEVEVQLTPMRTSFKNYEAYKFDSPIRTGGNEQQILFSGNLDKDGKADFSTKCEVSDAAGLLRANYFTKVYEKGGDYSVDRKMATFSPYDAYVGIKTPKGSKYDLTLETEKKHRFSFAILNRDGNLKTGKRKLHLKIYKIQRQWWYSGIGDVESYNFQKATIGMRDTVLYTESGLLNFDYSVPKYSYGKYLFVVTDEKSGHQAGSYVHFDWDYWSRANRSDTEKASMLSFSTDKESYVKGEKVQLSIPSPTNGRALISVETSQKIVKKFWIETKAGETVCEFETTAEMSPNAFVHVTMIQPHHNTQNDLPIRMYGVMPIKVDDPFTHLKPVISMADEIRPESKAKIKIKEENGRKMTYTLAIVDEGLLDLTHFKTPQPWNTFYAKEALGIQTWDMYDEVIGAYSGSLDHMLSVGGDGSAIVGNGPKANRFPPMVRFIGPFEIPAGGSKTHTVDIPSYIGSVRVMVVARDKEAYGETQKEVKVKKPLMVLATMPRVLGPGEEFSLPVDVFAMEKHIKNVKVSIELNDMFKLEDSNSKSIEFTQEGDEVINFKVSTKERIGIGKVKIKAVSGNEVATQEIEIDIRPSNPYTYDTEEILLQPGASKETEFDFDGLTGSQSGVIQVSTLPAISLDKRMKYLINYPHGCVEQTTSSVFPQLYLNSLEELDAKSKEEVERNIKGGIERLQLFQNYEGGFGYWPGESRSSDWGTNYAGHFLLEAELAGYKVPAYMKTRWISYQKRVAENWDAEDYTHSWNSESQQLTQAYRLYLLALVGEPEIGAMNRLKEANRLSKMAKWRLATAYAKIGQIETAKKMIANETSIIAAYKELSGTFGSNIRDKAIILEAQILLKEQKDATETMKDVASILSSDKWMSTQETAYSLMSIALYANAKSGVSSGKLEYSLDGVNKVSKSIGKKISSVEVSETSGKRRLKLVNRGSAPLYVTVTTRKIPKVGNEQNKSSKLKMNVWYEDLDGKNIDPSKIEQGTEFMAFVQLINPSTRDYKEMALNQIFPSGWEVHNSRLFGGPSAGEDVRYQDIRDDRVLSYYNLKGTTSTVIKVRLHATYKGKFYKPAVYSEAMYDHGIQAQRKGEWVEVL